MDHHRRGQAHQSSPLVSYSTTDIKNVSFLTQKLEKKNALLGYLDVNAIQSCRYCTTYVDLIVIHAHQQHSKRRKTGQTREGHRRLNLIFIGKCLVQQKIIQTLWCSRQRRLMLASTQGTILILRQHITELFLIHPKSALIVLNVSKNCDFDESFQVKFFQ